MDLARRIERLLKPNNTCFGHADFKLDSAVAEKRVVVRAHKGAYAVFFEVNPDASDEAISSFIQESVKAVDELSKGDYIENTLKPYVNDKKVS